MFATQDIDETCLDVFRPGYLATFVGFHAQELGWSVDYTRLWLL